MTKVKKIKRLVSLGIITLITALIWVALDSYHQLVKQEQMRKVGDLIEPLDPNLNTEVLGQIETRKKYQLDEVEEFLLPTPTLVPTVSPELESIEEIGSPSGVTTESGTQQ